MRGNYIRRPFKDFTEAIQLDPESAYAYGNRGVAKAALGDAEGAIADFDTALRINPKYAEIYYESRARESGARTDGSG